MESLIVSLVLAAVGGLAFLAYHHPAGYKRLAQVIFVVGMLWGLLALVWQVAGITSSGYLIAEQVTNHPTRPLSSIDWAARDLRDSLIATGWGIKIFVVATLYLAFLHLLPLLKEDGRAKPIAESSPRPRA